MNLLEYLQVVEAKTVQRSRFIHVLTSLANLALQGHMEYLIDAALLSRSGSIVDMIHRTNVS